MKPQWLRLNVRAHVCHLNFRILLTLKYRDDIVRNDNMEEVHIRRMYWKYENIKCQQLPLIWKMKLLIKLGWNAFRIFFHSADLIWIGLSCSVVGWSLKYQFVHYNLMWTIVKFEQYSVGVAGLGCLYSFRLYGGPPGQKDGRAAVWDSRLGISKYPFSIY